MEFTKSHWVADAENVSIAVPISKIDTAHRLVSGFATLDNVDTGDDVVTSEASLAAFNSFRGNIREMHQPIAAGRLFDFRGESFYDSNTEKFYNGVWVTAYISLGAESTWQKVLDGTLSGFSIGGKITESESEFVPDLGKVVRFVKGYNLIELSLVDNPANQFANVLSVVKNGDATFIKGIVSDVQLVNVFWCPSDKIAKNSESETEDCIACGNAMQQIDWFEKGDDAAVKTANAVSTFLRQKEDTSAVTKSDTENGEGGVNMADEEKKADDVVTSDDVTATEQTDAAEANKDDTVVESEEAGEEVSAEPDFEKMFDDLKGSVKESIEKTVQAVEEKVASVSARFDEKASELEKTIGELREGLDAIKTEREDVDKALKVAEQRLEALEKSSAIKKSGEVETTTTEKKVQKGLWAGAFFDAE